MWAGSSFPSAIAASREIFGNGDQRGGAARGLDEGAVALRDILRRKEFRIGLVLQIVDDADGRNIRLEIGWRRKRTEQQIHIEISHE